MTSARRTVCCMELGISLAAARPTHIHKLHRVGSLGASIEVVYGLLQHMKQSLHRRPFKTTCKCCIVCLTADLAAKMV